MNRCLLVLVCVPCCRNCDENSSDDWKNLVGIVAKEIVGSWKRHDENDLLKAGYVLGGLNMDIIVSPLS